MNESSSLALVVKLHNYPHSPRWDVDIGGILRKAVVGGANPDNLDYSTSPKNVQLLIPRTINLHIT